MKKKVLSKVVAIVAAVSMCFGGITAFASEENVLSTLEQSGDPISPYFIAIVSCTNNLTPNSGGRLTCLGKTEVQYGKIAGVTVELQQYNGGWKTIKTWGKVQGLHLFL